MQIETVIADIGIGAISGSVGTNVMEPVSMTLYEWERIDLSEQHVKKAGLGCHYGHERPAARGEER